LYSPRVRRAGPGAGLYGHRRRTHLDEAVNSTGGEARGDLMSCERGHARQHTVRVCQIGAEFKFNRRRHPNRAKWWAENAFLVTRMNFLMSDCVATDVGAKNTVNIGKD
jgi:hypothetical protein